MKKLLIIFGIVLLSACGGNPSIPDENSASPPSDSQGGESGRCGGASKRHGVNFVCWYKGCYQEEEVAASLDAFRGIGGNWLAIVPTWYQDNLSSNIIYEDATKSPTEGDIRAVVALAREKGFKILFKPHIDIESGGWRGDIEPSDLNAWHDSYRSFILTSARLAEELGIETMAIGTELKRRSNDASFWRGLIGEIRDVYSGELTYAANWDEYDYVSFWDLVDFIGIDFYFPLTDNKDATQEDMEAGLVQIGDTLRVFSERQGKPFLLTEIGYRSYDGTNTKPNDYSSNGAVDLQEQSDAYAAVLTTFESADWFNGMFLWRWGIRLEGAEDEGYLVYGKPAADILKQFWEGTCN